MSIKQYDIQLIFKRQSINQANEQAIIKKTKAKNKQFYLNQVYNCGELIAMNPSGVCSRYREECCASCKDVEVDSRCPEGNQVDNCEELIDEHGQDLVCMELADECCVSCL